MTLIQITTIIICEKTFRTATKSVGEGRNILCLTLFVVRIIQTVVLKGFHIAIYRIRYRSTTITANLSIQKVQWSITASGRILKYVKQVYYGLKHEFEDLTFNILYE